MCWHIYILRSVDSTPDEGDGSKDKDGRKQHSGGVDDELVDMFSEFYQPYDLTVLENLYPHVMQKSCRYMTCNFFFQINLTQRAFLKKSAPCYLKQGNLLTSSPSRAKRVTRELASERRSRDARRKGALAWLLATPPNGELARGLRIGLS